MAINISELKIKVTAETDQAEKDLKTLDNLLKQFSQTASQTANGFNSFGNNLKNAFGGATTASNNLSQAMQKEASAAKVAEGASNALGGGIKNLVGFSNEASGSLGRLASTAGGTLVGGVQKAHGMITGLMGMFGKVVGMTGLVSGGLGLAFGKSAVSDFADFESVLNQVGAVASDVGEEQIKKLTDRSLELGQKFPLSAKDAANGFLEMAKAGFSYNEMMQMSQPLVELTMAGQIDMGRGAEILSAALRGFGIDASQTDHVVDLLSATVNASAVDMNDLAETMKMVGPGAKSAGYSINDVMVATGMLGNVMIKGTDAGTGLRKLFSSFASPTKNAAEAFQTLNVNTKNADGSMRPFMQVIGELHTKMSGLSASQKIDLAKKIAGQEHFTKLLALVDAAPKDIEAMQTAIDHADGSAQKLGDTFQQGISGQLQNLSGTFDTFKLALGKAFQPVAAVVIPAINNMVVSLFPLADWLEKRVPSAVKTFQGGFQIGIDAVKTFKSALEGNWQDNAAKIMPFHRAVGNLGLAIHSTLIPALAFLKQKFDEIVVPIFKVVSAFSPLMTAIDMINGAVNGGLNGAMEALRTHMLSVLMLLGQDAPTASQNSYNAMKFLEGAIRGVAQFVSGTLVPAFSKIIEVVGPMIPTIAAAAGIFFSITSAISGVAAVVAPLAALFNPVGLAIAGVSLFIAALVTDFGGIRTTLQPIAETAINVFQNQIMPAIGRLAEWVQGRLIPALQIAGQWLANTFGPVIQQAISIITGTFIPAIGKIAQVLMDQVIPFLLHAGEVVASFLAPILKGLADVVQGTLLPILQQIGQWIMSNGIPAFQAFVGFLDSVVMPILSALAGFIGPGLGVAFQNMGQMIKGAWDTIVNVLSAGWAVIEGIINTISALLKGDFSGAWNALTGMVGKVWSGITGAIGSAAGAILGIIGRIIDFIIGPFKGTFAAIGGWVSGAWNAVTSAIGTAIGATIQAIQTAWNGVTQWIGQAVQTVGQVIATGWNWVAGVTSTVWGVISSVISSVWNFIASIISAAVNVVTTIISTAWNVITTIISVPLGIIVGIIQTAWSVIAEVTGFAWQIVSTIIGTVLGVIGSIVQTGIDLVTYAVSAGWQLISDVTSTVWNAIVSIVSPIFDTISQGLTTAFNIMLEVVTTVWNGISEATSTVWNGISDVLNTVWNGISSTVSSVTGAIMGFVTGAWNTISGSTSAIWDGVLGFISNAIHAAQDVVNGVVGGIQSFIGTAWDTISSKTSEIWNTITSVISTTWDGIKSFVTTAIDNVKSTLETAWNNIKSTVENAWNNIKSAILNGLNSIKDAITGFVSTALAEAEKIGKAIIDGIVNGIKNFAGNVKDAIGGAVGGVIDFGKGLLGIHSPSTVFMEMGQFTMQGMAIGVRNSSDLAINETARAGSGMMDAMKKNIDQGTKKPVDAMKNASDKVAQAAAKSGEGAGTIADAMRKMGGGLSAKDLETIAKEAENYSKIADSTSKMVDALTKVRGYVPVAKEIIASFTADTTELVSQYAGAAGKFSKGMLDGAANYADSSGKVAQGANSMATALKAIGSYISPGKDAIYAFSVDSQDMVARYYNASLIFTADMLQAATSFAETAGKVAQASSSMATALKAVQDYVSPGGQAIYGFSLDVQDLVARFYNDSQIFNDKMLAAASSFSDTSKKVAEASSSMATALKAVKNYVSPGADAIYGFSLDTQDMVARFYNASRIFNDKMLAATSAFADASKKVADGVSAGVKALEALRDYKPGADNIQPFIDDLQTVVAAFVNMSKDFELKSVQAAAQVADSFKKIVDIIAPSIKALDALKDYKDTAESQMVLFTSDLRNVINQFAISIQGLDPEIMAANAAIAESMGKITKGLGDAMGLFTGLQTYKSVPEATIQAFIDNVKLAVTLAANMSQTIMPDLMAKTAEFGVATGKIFAGFKTAMEVFTGLQKYKSIPPAVIQDFIASIITTVNIAASLNQTVDQSLMSKAQEFATATDKVFSKLKSGIDVFKSLEGLKQNPSNSINGLVDGIVAAIARMADASAKAGDLLAKAQDFATKMEAAAQAAARGQNAMSGIGAGGVPSSPAGSGSSGGGSGSQAVVPQFADGGIVPGKLGQPILAVVHGGERFLGVTGHRRDLGGPGGGGGADSLTVNFNGDIVFPPGTNFNNPQALKEAMIAAAKEVLKGQSTRATNLRNFGAAKSSLEN